MESYPRRHSASLSLWGCSQTFARTRPHSKLKFISIRILITAVETMSFNTGLVEKAMSNGKAENAKRKTFDLIPFCSDNSVVKNPGYTSTYHEKLFFSY